MLFRSWLEKTLINYLGNKCNSFVKLSSGTISNICPTVLKVYDYLSMALRNCGPKYDFSLINLVRETLESNVIVWCQV